jgi:hypothetical protein
MKQRVASLVLGILCVCLAAESQAQTATSQTASTNPASTNPASQPAASGEQKQASTQPAASDPVEDWIQKTKQPVSWFKWGADLRLRDEYLNNNVTLDKSAPGHERNYGRYRTRLWTTVTPVKDIDINTRYVWEFRTYSAPEGPLRQTNLEDVIIDTLNVKWRNFLQLPVTMTVGRQDITDLGNGWLVFDGTPLDGSRTIFFDAVRATWDIKDAKTSIDAIYLNDGAREDRAIEPFNYHDPKFLSEQDEQGVILWLTNKSIAKTELNAFFIYKKDDRAKSDYPSTGETGEVYTPGVRAAGDIDEHWKYRGEISPQFGHKNGDSLAALGANSRLSYFVNDKLNNNFRVDYEYLSGDDPDTKRNEGFDILWGRYPRWSEIYANTVAMETGRAGYYTNMHRVGPGWSINPTKKLELATDYQLLFAAENMPKSNPKFSDKGLFRGQLLTFLARYTFNKHVSTYIRTEVFGPGNFYSKANNDTAFFFRYELNFTW